MKKATKIVIIVSALVLSIVSIVLIGSLADDTVDFSYITEAKKSDLTFKMHDTIPYFTVSSTTGTEIVTNVEIDQYLDSNGNTLWFFPSSDVLCGYRKANYSSYVEQLITSDEAVQLANEYMEEIIPEFANYQLIETGHEDMAYAYHVQYAYQIAGVPTDDIIDVYIKDNGELGMFKMFKRGAFTNLTANAEEIASIEREENLATAFLTVNQEGLVFIQYYTEIQADGTEIMKISSHLIDDLQ